MDMPESNGGVSSTIMESIIKPYSKGCGSEKGWVFGAFFTVRLGFPWRGGGTLVTVGRPEGAFPCWSHE